MLPTEDFRVVVIGAGFSGLAMAIRLKQAGIDFAVLERGAEVGGIWRENSYPGCACDAPSRLYSYSFASNDWSRSFSPQPEIWDYLRRCAQEFDVRRHIRFGHEVTQAAWREETGRWWIETPRGNFSAQVLVSAMGAINEPAIPPIPGLDAFPGTLFHSSRWRHDHDMTNERVAVIGTGASAAQFIPSVQPRADRLYVFQRTPPWILPRNDRRFTTFERALFRRLPVTDRIVRAIIYWARETFILGFAVNHRFMAIPEWVARAHLWLQVRDRELRRRLTPSYRIGCKRIVLSDDYYPALTQPNAEVVTEGIREVRGSTIVTEDGGRREVDTIILGTGFRVAGMEAVGRVRGRDGVPLSELWHGTPQAYLGTTVAGLPNFFMLLGPNTILGHTSMVFMIESQVRYVMDSLRVMDDRGVAAVEVSSEAQEAFNRELGARMSRTVWASGCRSWYLNDEGRNTTLWPGFTWGFRQRLRRFNPAEYRLSRRSEKHAPAAVS